MAPTEKKKNNPEKEQSCRTSQFLPSNYITKLWYTKQYGADIKPDTKINETE